MLNKHKQKYWMEHMTHLCKLRCIEVPSCGGSYTNSAYETEREEAQGCPV